MAARDFQEEIPRIHEPIHIHVAYSYCMLRTTLRTCSATAHATVGQQTSGFQYSTLCRRPGSIISIRTASPSTTISEPQRRSPCGGSVHSSSGSRSEKRTDQSPLVFVATWHHMYSALSETFPRPHSFCRNWRLVFVSRRASASACLPVAGRSTRAQAKRPTDTRSSVFTIRYKSTPGVILPARLGPRRRPARSVVPKPVPRCQEVPALPPPATEAREGPSSPSAV
jgi:hypothetical protein